MFTKPKVQPRAKPAAAHVGKARDRVRTQMFKGVAELALLRVLHGSPEYGLKILDALREDAGLDIAEGTLYPLLYRLEKQGSIGSEWRLLDEASHPRKYYALTPQGEAELEAHIDDWQSMITRFNRFLDRGKK